MADKVRYFLKEVRSVEWSGPAWYSHKKDEDGFPEEITLEYWHPLHLGTSGETDWDGKDLIKIFPKLRKEFPKIGKEWVQGNIHSHHNMGAFFSGTDNQQLEDGANENFYYSLVVSYKAGKELAFAMSYPDQFGVIHIHEIDDIEFETVELKDKNWTKELKWIKEQKKKAPKETKWKSYGSYINNINGQGTLFQGQQADEKIDIGQEFADHEDFLSYNGYNTGLSMKQYIGYLDIIEKHELGKLSTANRDRALKNIGVDEYGQPILTK